MSAPANGMRPVFLVSLPRSGSTLLQKMLAVSPRVASAAEPWLMLPLAYLFRPDGAAAEFGHRAMTGAVADVAEALPGGRPELLARMGDFVRGVYAGVAEKSGRGDADWFLDKTPRYYLIVPFLLEVFPDARFLFLFRNPLEVFASIVRTWHGDRLGPSLTGNFVDFAKGPACMAEGLGLAGERALAVHYQQLVTDPEGTLRAVCAHLDIPFEPALVASYRDVEFSGSMGDPTGVGSYAAVSTESLARWRGFAANHVRRAFLRHHLARIDDATLAAFGQDRAALLAELAAVPVSFRGDGRDGIGLAAASLARLLDGPNLRRFRRARAADLPVVPFG
jgi:hypothetical protein